VGNPNVVNKQKNDCQTVQPNRPAKDGDQETFSSCQKLRANHVDLLCLDRFGLLLLFDLEEKGAIDVGKDTSESDGGAD
jgi:hypothetical protein